VLLLIPLFFTGFSWSRARNFEQVCDRVAAGTPLAEADAALRHAGGRPVTRVEPKPDHSEFRFRKMWGTDPLCELETADGLVVKTSRFSSLRL
jgi:hypothetical protein